MKSTVRTKALLSIKKPKTLKSAERLIQEQRIVLESLLASIDKHLGGADGSEKKISSLIVVLETLASECRKIRDSEIESKLSKDSTKADTASGE